MLINLEKISDKCREFRYYLGYKQYQVAHDTGYSKENVSAFECGRNNNAVIFGWYVEMGLSDYLFEKGENLNG